MKKAKPALWLLCAVTFYLTITGLAYAQSFTLDGAINQALKANPTMEQQMHALERAKMDVGVAQSIFWPRATFVTQRNMLRNSGSVGDSNQLSSDEYSYGLRLTLSLFAGFQHLTALQQSLIQKEIAELTKRQAELELIANVKIMFFTYLQAKRDIRLAKDSIKRMETQLQASEAFVKEDLAPYVNVLQNKVELARGKEQLINAENTYNTSRIQLNQFLGYEPDKKIEYRGELEDFKMDSPFDEQKSMQLALNNRPDVQIAQKSVDVARKRMYQAAGQALPMVDLNYDNMKMGRDYTSNRYEDYNRQYWTAGVTLTWPFFEGGRTVFGTLSEKKNMDAMAAAYKNTMDTARTDVLRSIMDLDAARKTYDTAKEAITSATESYAQARYRYDTGIGTITELMDSQTRLTEAETRCSMAMSTYQIAYARYLYYIGGKMENQTVKKTPVKKTK